METVDTKRKGKDNACGYCKKLPKVVSIFQSKNVFIKVNIISLIGIACSLKWVS